MLNSILKLIRDHPRHPWITSILILRRTEPTHLGLSTLHVQRLFQCVSTMEGIPTRMLFIINLSLATTLSTASISLQHQDALRYLP